MPNNLSKGAPGVKRNKIVAMRLDLPIREIRLRLSPALGREAEISLLYSKPPPFPGSYWKQDKPSGFIVLIFSAWGAQLETEDSIVMSPLL